MNKKVRKWGAYLLAAALIVTSLAAAPGMKEKATAATRGTFKNLNQAEITAAMGAGWNVGNQLEANSGGTPSETAWVSTPITKELIFKVKEAGFTSIRVPISYLSMIGEGPDYTINEEWMKRIQEVVDYCMEADLYTIINMHGDGYNSVQGGWLLCNDEKNQETIKAKYAACWKQIATRFADYDEHLIFESMNEEFDGNYNTPDKDYYANINTYNQIFVDTVRQSGGNNAKRWLLIPGWNTDIEYTAGDYGFALPTDNYLSAEVPAGEKRIMVSVHYYNPWGFAGEESESKGAGYGTRWGDKAKKSKTVNYGYEADMDANFKRMHDTFVAAGYPVVIGEYGSIDKTWYDEYNNLYRAYYANSVCHYAKQYGCIPVYWDNGWNGKNGFGLFDRGTMEVTQQGIIDAIMAVYKQTPSVKYEEPDIEPTEDYYKDAIYLKPVLSKKAGQLTLEWEYRRDVDGYEILISTSKNFKKAKKTYTIKDFTVEKKVIKGLKKGKKYFVKIRAYTKINGKKYYSAWSDTDYEKIKK